MKPFDLFSNKWKGINKSKFFILIFWIIWRLNETQDIILLHLRLFDDLVSKVATNSAKEIWFNDSFCDLQWMSFEFRNNLYNLLW